MGNPSKSDKEAEPGNVDSSQATQTSANIESNNLIAATAINNNRDMKHPEKSIAQADSNIDENSSIHAQESAKVSQQDTAEDVADSSTCNLGGADNIDDDNNDNCDNDDDDRGLAQKNDESGAYDNQNGSGRRQPSEETDEGEPLPSGTGTVAKECDPSDLCGWSDLLPKWQNNLNQRPRGLGTLVWKNGVPEPLRGEVWQLLSGAHLCQELMDNYRVYLTKSTPSEQIIARDVHRTFPAHENFRPGAGSSSLLDSLFKVCKAYAVYDTEVNYLQSMSFLVAALLLHMPEEQAFCVLVRIMYNYGLRDLFRNNFDQLHLKFFQLDKLLLDHHPDLHRHFAHLGLEPFTYANSWFLSLFTAKLPLNAVFRILDILLLDNMDTTFRVALSLLGASKRDLLLLDFEGVLKYLRITMPKLYQDQDNVHELITAAFEVDLRRLKKYAKEYEQIKQKERMIESPVSRLQREKAKLTENNLRLESENENLTRESLKLKAQLDVLQDKTEIINRALVHSRQDCQSYLNTISDIEDEKSRFEVENSQLKAVCRREMSKAETEIDRNIKIVAEYKKISSQLGRRLDFRLKCAEQFVDTMQSLMRDNESCEDRKCLQTFQRHASEFLARLSGDKLSDGSLGSTNEKTDATSETAAAAAAPPNPRLLQRMTSSESDYANRPVGAYVKTSDAHSSSSELKIKQLTQHIDELEVELARTKLALVESECKCQQLMHDNQAGARMIRSSSGAAPAATSAEAQPSSNSSSFNRLNLGAFAKINNIISERISNMSQQAAAAAAAATAGTANSLPNSISTPVLDKKSQVNISTPESNRDHC